MPQRIAHARLILLLLAPVALSHPEVRAQAPAGAQPAAASPSRATQAEPAPAGEAAAPAEGAPQVIIDRAALKLIDAADFQVPLHLDPKRSIRIVAPCDGVVRNVTVKPGEEINEGAVIAGLDATERELILEVAKANHRAAQAAAQEAGADEREPAAARVEAAAAELKLAEYRLAQTRVIAPFNGQVFRIEAEVGQFVKAGELLMTVADPSVLTVEVPVDRTQAQPGGAVEVFVEDQAVQAKIESILPLHEKFEPLRALLQTVASAEVVIDNANGARQPGQTVTVPLIPRDPVVEVATVSIANSPDGNRLVKVIRNGVVRDVTAKLLGSLGPERTYVSGPFAQGDELILKSSQDLPDGTEVRPAAAEVAAPAKASPAAGERAQPKPRTGGGF